MLALLVPPIRLGARSLGVATPLWIELGDSLEVRLNSFPGDDQLVRLAGEAGARAPEEAIDAFLAERARIRASTWVETRLSLRAVGPGVLTVWSTDFSVTAGLRATRPSEAGFELYGGPVGMHLLVCCTDSIVLAQRGLHLATRPGQLGLFNEGVVLDDLREVNNGGWVLGISQLAGRLLEEELGVLTADVTPHALWWQPGEPALLVVAEVPLSFEELELVWREASDRDEQSLVRFASLESALAYAGGDMVPTCRDLLTYLVSGSVLPR